MSETTDNWLDSIVIASPCSEPWDGMRGDERLRRCAACRLDVHNIVAMKRADAEALFANADGRICARIYRRPDGTVLTEDCAPARNRVARSLRRMRVVLTSVLALFGLAGCSPQSMVSTGVVAPPPSWDIGPDDLPTIQDTPEAGPTEAK